MKRNSALAIIREIDPYLRPACVRLEPAGSVRRGKSEVGDIELLAVVKPGNPRPEFGKPAYVFQTHIDKAIDQMREDDYLVTLKRNGPHWKTLLLNPMKFPSLVEKDLNLVEIAIDLFIVLPPGQWGVLMMIRTGPGGKGGFSQWMVTPQSKGGALPNGYMVKDGAVWETDLNGGRLEPVGEPIPMPEEGDYFDLCGLPFIHPRLRIPQWRKHQ